MKIIFTKHAILRALKRNTTEQKIIESIKNADKTIKKHGKYYYQKRLEIGTIEIVCEMVESVLNVISVYWL
jgi:hypothetical protein